LPPELYMLYTSSQSFAWAAHNDNLNVMNNREFLVRAGRGVGPTGSKEKLIERGL